MSNYIVTSPVFGAFRSGEPKAFVIAKKVMEYASSNDFKTKYVTKDGSYKVHVLGREIWVWLNEKEDPFKFLLEEI